MPHLGYHPDNWNSANWRGRFENSDWETWVRKVLGATAKLKKQLSNSHWSEPGAFAGPETDQGARPSRGYWNRGHGHATVSTPPTASVDLKIAQMEGHTQMVLGGLKGRTPAIFSSTGQRAARKAMPIAPGVWKEAARAVGSGLCPSRQYGFSPGLLMWFPVLWGRGLSLAAAAWPWDD